MAQASVGQADHRIVAFSAPLGYGGQSGRGQSGLTPVAISPRRRLDDVIRKTDGIPFGGTDCARPKGAKLAHLP